MGKLVEEVLGVNWTPWIVLGAFLTGVTCTATIDQWRIDSEINGIKAKYANEKADVADKALKDLATASKSIKSEAEGNRVDVAELNDKLDKLRRDFKNEKPKPLPVDCVPDPIRVHMLGKTIDAVNETVTGRKSGDSMSTDSKTGK